MKSTNVQIGTTPAIVGNNVLSPVVVEALQNDTHLKELYKRLSEIHSKAFPIVVQVSPAELKAKEAEKRASELSGFVGMVFKSPIFRKATTDTTYGMMQWNSQKSINEWIPQGAPASTETTQEE